MKSLEGVKQKYEKLSEEHPIIATLGETAVVFALKYGLEKGGEKLGVSLGHGRKKNPTRNEFIDNHPHIARGAAIIAAPIAEELLFREFPATHLEKNGHDKDSSVSKRAKFGVTALFAATHAGPDAVPLPQLVGGLHYNRVHEKRGLKHSILAHAANNAFAVARYGIEKRSRKS